MTRRTRDSHPQPLRHAESLLDEAIAETFPASDPVAATQPGSVVSRVYTRRDARRRSNRSLAAWMLAGVALGVVGWAVARASRRRRR